MENLYYKDVYGNRAGICETADKKVRLVCRDKQRSKWKDKTYNNLRGAKTALGMSGPWIEITPRKAV